MIEMSKLTLPEEHGAAVEYEIVDAVARSAIDALYPKKSIGPSSAVAVTDARQENALDVTIGIEPVQDLHGYDNPWPAGGGENLLPFDEVFEEGWTDTLNGLTATYSKGYMRVTGTNTSTTWTNIVNKDAVWANNVKTFGPGNYVMGGDNKGLVIACMIDGGSRENKSIPFTAETSVAVRGFYIAVAGEATVDWNIPMMFIRGTDRPTAYSPYSNICPITGWTGAKVTRTGKNLLDVDRYGMSLPKTQKGITWSKVRDGVYHASGTATASSYFNVSFDGPSVQNAMPCTQFTGQQLRISATNEKITYGLGYFRGDNTFTNMINGGVLPDDAAGLRAYVSVAKDIVIDTDFSIQLELGSTATDYEPYQGETYSIAFPTEAGTVYGGTLDVTTGVLTVDMASVDLSTLTWVWDSTYEFWRSDGLNNVIKKSPAASAVTGSICEEYNAYGYNVFQVDKTIIGFAVATTGRVAVRNGSTTVKPTNDICYELATPITYQLTSQQVALLLGNNTVFADTGDTTLTYQRDVALLLGQL